MLLVIAAIMKKQAPDSSNNIAMSVAACIAAGAFGGVFQSIMWGIIIANNYFVKNFKNKKEKPTKVLLNN